MSPRLRAEVTAYQLCMLDDSMVEGPHASIGRATRGAARSRPAWWSATLRADQNSMAREQSMEDIPDRFEWLFNSWKILGQRDMVKYRRGIPQRISTKSFIDFVYRSGSHNMTDWSALIGRKDRSSQPGQVPPVSVMREIKRDYISCVFRPGQFFELPVHDHVGIADNLASGTPVSAEAGTASMMFKIVSQRLVSKKYVDTEGLNSLKRMECPAVVQHISARAGTGQGPQGCEVYEDGLPEPIDLMKVSTWDIIWTKTARREVSTDAAEPGCLRLGPASVVGSHDW